MPSNRLRLIPDDISGLEVGQQYMIGDLFETIKAAIELDQLTPEEVLIVLSRLSKAIRRYHNRGARI